MPADIASTYIHRKSLSSSNNYAFKYNLSVMVYSLVRIPIKSELFVLPTDVLNGLIMCGPVLMEWGVF
jgi:hypothetical protein